MFNNGSKSEIQNMTTFYLDGILLNAENDTEYEAGSIPEPLVRLAGEHSSGIFCVYAYGRNFLALDCNDKYPCGVCEIKKKQNYYLKGLMNGKSGFVDLFDSQFYFDGYINKNPRFR